MSAPRPSPKRLPEPVRELGILDESAFRRFLQIEEKRTERSRRRFVLMLLECNDLICEAGPADEIHDCDDALIEVLRTLSHSIRETDIIGWYSQHHTLGVIFTEIGPVDGHSVTKALLNKISGVLSSVLTIEQVRQVKVSFYVYPEDDCVAEAETRNRPGASRYADLADDDHGPSDRALKRTLDIAGSLAALTFLSPVFLVVGLAVKLTSKGPVFFRQKRVGYRGRQFTFLKFRSMHVDNSTGIHEEFVKKLIRGEAIEAPADGLDLPKPVFKLVNDPRVTPIGRFLRRTSLDELPQFVNVLRGDMSLVGPRPAIPYEVRCYDLWHKRRHYPVKPGITGLWQVKGRSRVGFDDMIRLDLQYARSWSIGLDLKILLQTPLAVVLGEGAY